MPAPIFYWSESARRFKDEQGRFVSRERMDAMRNRYYEREKSISAADAGKLFAGDWSLSEWRDRFGARVERIFTDQYVASRGGFPRMTDTDYRELAGMVEFQLDRLNNHFAVDLANGRYAVDQTQNVIDRMNLYVDASGQAWERGSLETFRGSPQLFLWRWLPGKEHCEDCEWANGRVGTADYWLGLGMWPKSAGLSCIGIHCGCFMVPIEESEIQDMLRAGLINKEALAQTVT